MCAVTLRLPARRLNRASCGTASAVGCTIACTRNAHDEHYGEVQGARVEYSSGLALWTCTTRELGSRCVRACDGVCACTCICLNAGRVSLGSPVCGCQHMCCREGTIESERETQREREKGREHARERARQRERERKQCSLDSKTNCIKIYFRGAIPQVSRPHCT